LYLQRDSRKLPTVMSVKFQKANKRKEDRQKKLKLSHYTPWRCLRGEEE
jgi:hypothetical protein